MKSSGIRTAALIAISAVGTLLATGCGGAIVGYWRLHDAKPNRQVFSLDHANFRSDGTFAVTTTIEGMTQRESGTYKFIGYKLKLHPEGGGQRAYTSKLRGGRLELRDGDNVVVLKKSTKGKKDGG